MEVRHNITYNQDEPLRSNRAYRMKRRYGTRPQPLVRRRRRDVYSCGPRQPTPIAPEDTDACTSLWRSVVMQALYDVDGTHIALRSEALAWFAGPEGGDFEFVCELAELNPQVIRAFVRRNRNLGRPVVVSLNSRSWRRASSSRPGRRSRLNCLRSTRNAGTAWAYRDRSRGTRESSAERRIVAPPVQGTEL